MKEMSYLLITANVGSLFELWDSIAKAWFDTISASVSRLSPNFLAFHFQEVGGKDPKISMKQIEVFSKIMLQLPALHMYKLAIGHLDTDCDDKKKYTALGSFYFIDQSLEHRISIWDFNEERYLPLKERRMSLSSDFCDERFKKVKFPPELSPEKCWCRKGFLHTKWRIDEIPFNFVNIHMFHDTSNLVALESSPSVYADCRQRALKYTLDYIDDFEAAPTFIFGDFNFRTDVKSAVQDLTKSLRPKSIPDNHDHRVSFSDDLDRNVLLVGKKEFQHKDHETVFTTEPKWLKHDAELRPFKDWLYELEVNFPPSYPCQEESDVVRYLPTRCPAWCDRVLMNRKARELLSGDFRYNMIGKKTSMGDHKPVYLNFVQRIWKRSPSTEEEDEASPIMDCIPQRTVLVNHNCLCIN
ncbi:inositol polyphosphate-5-phosphatase A-like isoform X2 [Artemia franciscana]|uniref:inositol polyphosphate-5-phosphatase A-like isoform X2 n=1 Tax=Artemia franciscana TaxID=6661 RepID=UPI0032DA578B